jgi:peptidoglycan/LPS O-acetylase OafA/YrhL
MKIVFYLVMTIAIILVTFFGLGPVIFADGSMGERLATLLVVVLLYLLLAWIMVIFVRYNRNAKK